MSSKKIVPYVLIMPLLLAFAIFMIYPLYKVVETSFYKVSFLNPTARLFVGFDNYRWLLNFKVFNPKYSYFVTALGKSLIWVAGSVLLKVIIGMAGALLLNSKFLAGRKVYRALVIVPWAIPWAMSSMMWAWTLNSQFGVVNSIMMKLNLIEKPITFLSDPTMAFVTTMVVDAWVGLPFMIIMFLSGLQSIPDTLYEAAIMDGANEISSFFKITLPLMKPVILTVSLLSLVWTFNSFDIIWILTRGGPLRATETLPIAIYNTSFRLIRFGGIGKASAMTVVQVLIVTLISIFYIRTLEKGETR
ncbi:MAG TPA: sugar ABC transporter permease [Thermotoga sp.]|nr:MAG: sugar ABC transporter permease [Thermotoga sp.]HDG62491.1 sugar ABC transporter permease [Thermotoga sp.]